MLSNKTEQDLERKDGTLHIDVEGTSHLLFHDISTYYQNSLCIIDFILAQIR